MFITMDRRLAEGTFIDLGMFIQSILVGARGEGLHTCGQVAFTKFHTILSKELEFDENEMLCVVYQWAMKMRMHQKIN